MQAIVTYHGGKSYWYGKTRFKLDIAQTISDPGIISHCQQTSGFTVALVEQPKQPKQVREVAKPRKVKKKFDATA